MLGTEIVFELGSEALNFALSPDESLKSVAYVTDINRRSCRWYGSAYSHLFVYEDVKLGR